MPVGKQLCPQGGKKWNILNFFFLHSFCHQYFFHLHISSYLIWKILLILPLDQLLLVGGKVTPMMSTIIGNVTSTSYALSPITYSSNPNLVTFSSLDMISSIVKNAPRTPDSILMSLSSFSITSLFMTSSSDSGSGNGG